MEAEIEQIVAYRTKPIAPEWLGVYQASGSPVPEDGYEGHHRFNSGWRVLGKFFDDNMGSAFEMQSAFHAEFPNDLVFGSYEDGLICSSKEALEHFVEHHPPHQSD